MDMLGREKILRRRNAGLRVRRERLAKTKIPVLDFFQQGNFDCHSAGYDGKYGSVYLCGSVTLSVLVNLLENIAQKTK